MRIRFRLLMVMSLGAQALAMTPQYSSYVNRSVDANHIYATAVVDGTTSCDPNCPLGAMHTGKVYLTLAGNGGWVNGNTVTPQTYISVSNSQTLNATSGVNYAESDQENVYCSNLGHNIFQVSSGPLLRIADTNFVQNGLGSCKYTLSCPNGNNKATCANKTEYDLNSPCTYLYVHSHDLVVDGVCTYVGTAEESTVPILCN